MLSLPGYVLADPRLERVLLPMIRPLAPFTVRPIRQSNVRRTVSAATITEAAAIESSITPSRRPIKSSLVLSPKIRIVGRGRELE